ncbi:MAG: phage major capsid protein [Actinomycetes bacterium]
MYDYRKIEERNKGLQAEIDKVLAKEERTADDSTRIAEFMGQIHANDALAGELREAELVELREIAARGVAVDGGLSPEKQAEADASKAFRSYMRSGEEGIPAELRATAMSTTDANGGYIVPEPVHGPVLDLARKYNPIFANATMFELTGDTTMYLPYKSAHGVATTAAEAASHAEQNAPTLGNASLICYDYFSDQRATQQFVDSAIVNGQPAEDWLIQQIYADIIEKAELDAVTGTGSTALTGMFSSAAASYYTPVLSGSADTIANTGYLKWFFSLHPKYRAAGKWVMNSTTLAAAAGMVWPNSYDRLVTVGTDGKCFLMGKEVLETQSAPSIGNGLIPVAFGDIAKGYAVGVHRSVSILRDPYTATPKIRYYGLGRIGGVPWDPAAIILGKSDDA